jgi:hypothetical protein
MAPIPWSTVWRGGYWGDVADAEEVTLDVYTQVWKTARNLDPHRGTVSAWLVMLCALGALEEAERAALSFHLLAGCPRCAAALTEARDLLSLLAWLAPPVSPPHCLRARILA